MPNIALLISESDCMQDGNYLRLGNELQSRGLRVSYCFCDSLALVSSQIVVSGFTPDRPIISGEVIPALQSYGVQDFSHLWLFSLGYRSSFLDKMQLLYAAGTSIQMINSLDAVMHLKSKYFLSSQPELFRYPETHASTNAAELHAIVNTGGTWIAKPPAGSLGRDVFILKPGDQNNGAILEMLCGHANDRYTLLQSYVEEIASGEKRVLFAGGKIVGQYHRMATRDHRTNLMQGGRPTPCELGDDERNYCQRLGEFLKDYGVGFAGLDLAYPWIIEFNVINPGGLITINELTGEDLAPVIVDALGF